MFLDPKTYRVLHYAGSRVGQANLFKLLVGFVVFGHMAIQKKTKNKKTLMVSFIFKRWLQHYPHPTYFSYIMTLITCLKKMWGPHSLPLYKSDLVIMAEIELMTHEFRLFMMVKLLTGFLTPLALE